MNRCKILLSLIMVFFMQNNVMASTDQVAKVALIKGNATELRVGSNQKIPLEKDGWVNRNSVIETEKSSVVKLIFIDQSKVTLGPESKLEVGKFAQNEVGMLSVMKGKLKATVLKNAMEREGKNKLYIKTQTAAMGVRGTEFMVMYNHAINKTSVITFSGEVVMAQVPKEIGLKMPINQLNQVLQREGSVSVTPGLYAGTSELGRPNIPTKINPTQFQSLKDSSMFEEGRKVASEVKSFQSKVPPNMDSKIFANQNSELQESMKNVLGEKQFETIETTVKQTIMTEQNLGAAPPEGFFNPDTNEFAPRAGGFIDVETGVYVIPPADSEFDPNTQTFIPPSSHGTVDESGAFRLPAGVIRNEDGTFVKVGDPTGGIFIQTDGGARDQFLGGMQTEFFKPPMLEGGTGEAMDMLDRASEIIPSLNPILPDNITNQNSLSLLKVSITVSN